MQGDIQKDAQQAQAVIENNGGDNITIEVPMQIYPLQKLDEKEIDKLTKYIGEKTISRINDRLLLHRGKISPVLKPNL